MKRQASSWSLSLSIGPLVSSSPATAGESLGKVALCDGSGVRGKCLTTILTCSGGIGLSEVSPRGFSP